MIITLLELYFDYHDYHILDILAHGSNCLDIMGLDILELDILGIIPLHTCTVPCWLVLIAFWSAYQHSTNIQETEQLQLLCNVSASLVPRPQFKLLPYSSHLSYLTVAHKVSRVWGPGTHC